MKILHTSDIHLRQFNDERWKTLENLLEIGKIQNVHLLIISGDLFDKSVNAEDLRPRLRELLSNNNFKILILPGNHDKKAFRSGLFFGEDVFVFDDLRNPFEIDELSIWGFPYQKLNSEEIYNKLHSLKEKLTPDKINILLYHGELLNSSFLRDDFGKEGDKRYMPVKLSYFKDLNFKYVLAGHFHSKFEVWQIDESKYFVYSGSPISITKKETGKRKVNIFETGDSPNEFELETPYFENITIEFDPIIDVNPLEKVNYILSNLDQKAKICLNTCGYLDFDKVGGSEKEFIEEIKKILPSNCIEDVYEFKDVSLILQDDLFKQFKNKLEEKAFLESKNQSMIELIINSMRGLNL